jgi:hypothetical protein
VTPSGFFFARVAKNDAVPNICYISRQKWPQFGAKDIAFWTVNM